MVVPLIARGVTLGVAAFCRAEHPDPYNALTAGPARSLDELCDSVLASLGADAQDDIALLLARTTDDHELSVKGPAAYGPDHPEVPETLGNLVSPAALQHDPSTSWIGMPSGSTRRSP